MFSWPRSGLCIFSLSIVFPLLIRRGSDGSTTRKALEFLPCGAQLGIERHALIELLLAGQSGLDPVHLPRLGPDGLHPRYARLDVLATVLRLGGGLWHQCRD